MVQLNKEVLPTDEFIISIPQPLSMNERQLLTLLYQPLTGATPISLYLLFWAEGEAETNEEMNHYHLMNVLDMPLRSIFEARISLEAIGLLRTYRKDEENKRRFIYELIRPLDATQFFSDPLLSMFLYSKIGEQAYRKLRNRYLNRVNKDGFTEVSRTFTDVYQPVNVRMPVGGIDAQKVPDSYPFYMDEFDFDLLKEGLSEQLVPTKFLTVEVRKIIAKLAFMYHFTALEMQKVVILAFDEDNKFSLERLKKAAADYYKITISKKPPKLAKIPKMIEFSNDKINSNEKLSKEEELLVYLDNTSPVEMLRVINDGKEPLPSSLEIVNDLLMTYEMPVGVVNVLLEYVMLSTDMKLPRKYVEQIADHWQRKGLQSAKEAIELARQERDQYAKWKTESSESVKNPKSAYNKRYNPKGRTEQVPEWFEKRNEKFVDQNEGEIDFEKEAKKLLAELDQL